MRVLAVSPHLDDVAFSCGGALATWVRAGRDVTVVTVFTRSVAPPLPPFALSTQTDKGLPPDVDYLALRRAEDDAAMRALGVDQWHHLDLPEAPHRGYTSAADLFAGVHADDAGAAAQVAGLVAPYAAEADVVLGPRGLGAHVDHLLVARGLTRLAVAVRTWRDTPYALRVQAAAEEADDEAVDVTDALAAKLAACAAYGTQLGFQFGGEEGMRAAVAAFATAEARRLGLPAHRAAEALSPARVNGHHPLSADDLAPSRSSQNG